MNKECCFCCVVTASAMRSNQRFPAIKSVNPQVLVHRHCIRSKSNIQIQPSLKADLQPITSRDILSTNETIEQKTLFSQFCQKTTLKFGTDCKISPFYLPRERKCRFQKNFSRARPLFTGCDVTFRWIILTQKMCQSVLPRPILEMARA